MFYKPVDRSFAKTLVVRWRVISGLLANTSHRELLRSNSDVGLLEWCVKLSWWNPDMDRRRVVGGSLLVDEVRQTARLLKWMI